MGTPHAHHHHTHASNVSLSEYSSVTSCMVSRSRAWICAAHFPVCGASTHGRAVCDTEFAAVTEAACPEVFGDPSTSTAAAAAAAAAQASRGAAFNATKIAGLLRTELADAGTRNGSVVSEDHGSCVHLDYSGPNYWNWVVS